MDRCDCLAITDSQAALISFRDFTGFFHRAFRLFRLAFSFGLFA